MIIILGPDNSGKTTLARKLNIPYYHFDQHSTYIDYLRPMVDFKLFNAVLDRHAICEYPYAKVMNRKFKFSMKEWHNLILLTLIQNPLIILSTHRPSPTSYPREQYLPYEKWDDCLNLYREFLNTNHITYVEYDFFELSPIKTLLTLEAKFRKDAGWWTPMWHKGYGCIGSTNPQVLLVAERIGPNNTNDLPFETGPTGYMLTDMLAKTGTPLGKFAVTNMVKSYRRDPRQPNQDDLDLLKIELEHLKPEKVVFMGAVAKEGIPVAKSLNIPYDTIVHLGSLNYAGVTDMTGYNNEWKKMFGMIPTLTMKRV